MNQSCSTPLRPVICGVDHLDQFCTGGFSHVVSIMDPGSAVPAIFEAFEAHERLDLRFHDIIDVQKDMIIPQRDHIDRLLQFGRSIHSRTDATLLVHCHAGVSRSTAAAVLLLTQEQCGRHPEMALARLLEILPNAWPNLRMIELGDELMHCAGQLVAAARDHYADLVERYPALGRAIPIQSYLRTWPSR